MSLAAVLILKNEEVMVRRCLESLRGVDEICCAVDTLTNDRTRDILQEMSTDLPIKVKEQKWPGSFGDARNDSLDMTECEWRLVIDADETLRSGHLPLVRQAVASTPLKAVSVRLQWKEGHRHFFPRIIRRGVRFTGIAHEYPEAGQAEGSDVVIDCESSPAHAGDPDRSLKLLAIAHVEEPDNPRTLYYLAREYWYRRKFKLALPLFKRCTELSKFPAERADAHLYRARMLWLTQKGDEARHECAMAIVHNANFVEALQFMGEMSFPRNRAAWQRFALKATNQDVLFER